MNHVIDVFCGRGKSLRRILLLGLLKQETFLHSECHSNWIYGEVLPRFGVDGGPALVCLDRNQLEFIPV